MTRQTFTIIHSRSWLVCLLAEHVAAICPCRRIRLVAGSFSNVWLSVRASLYAALVPSRIWSMTLSIDLVASRHVAGLLIWGTVCIGNDRIEPLSSLLTWHGLRFLQWRRYFEWIFMKIAQRPQAGNKLNTRRKQIKFSSLIGCRYNGQQGSL